MTNLDSILKIRDTALPTESMLCIVNVQSMLCFFSVVMYGCENWIIKKAEHKRTDTLKLWCWIKLWRVLWRAERSNQSILKETIP